MWLHACCLGSTIRRFPDTLCQGIGITFGGACEPVGVIAVALATARADDRGGARRDARGLGPHDLSRPRSAQRRRRTGVCGSRPQRRLPIGRRLPNSPHGVDDEGSRGAVRVGRHRTDRSARSRHRARRRATEAARRAPEGACRPRRLGAPALSLRRAGMVPHRCATNRISPTSRPRSGKTGASSCATGIPTPTSR